MQSARCDAVRVVTLPEKRDVAERSREHGGLVVEGHPASVADALLLGLDGLDRDDVVLFGFPDTIWEPVDGFRQLVAELGDVVLGLFRCRELTRSDVVMVEGGRVTAVHVKPESPPSDLVWGCLAAKVGALEGLAGHTEPGVYLDALAREGRVRGVDFGTEFVDIGTPESLRAAAQ